MIRLKRYYFTLERGTGKNRSIQLLYLRNKKFYCALQLHTHSLLSWRQAYWYWFLFNLPSWIKRNGSLFGYKHVIGIVKLHRMTDEQLD